MRTLKLLLIPAVLIVTGCMTTVHVPVMRPAPVHIDNHIQRVAVIDRTTPDGRTVNIVESVLTGELPGLHKDAVQRTLDGLVTTLLNSPRFEVVRTTESYSTSLIRGTMPDPLSWDEIAGLCAEYNCDAVLSLESFNSDFIVTRGDRNVKKEDDDGNEVTVKEYYAEGIAQVNLGFRLYDLPNRSIADAHMFDHSASWNAVGTSILDAVTKLVNHRQAVLNTGYNSGKIYAERIAPRWVTLNRQFYRKGRRDANFKIGVRRATVNDWEGAKEAWYKSVNSGSRRTAGRSAYNLALMYEISGDLQKAREWAQTAYTDYGINKARSYTSALDRRIRDQRRADAQME